MPLLSRGWMAAACAGLLGFAGIVLVHHSTAGASQGVSGDPTQRLVVDYGAGGLERLSWRGQVLEDVRRTPADAFHIWHMAATDLSGKPLTGGEYGWGENNRGRSWDAATKTWLYKFGWGTIRAQYQQVGDQLNIRIEEENRVGSGVVFQGASLYPLTLTLPGVRELPVSERGAGGPGTAVSDNTNAPGVTVREFNQGAVVLATPNVAEPLYSGCEPHPGDGTTARAQCAVLVSSARPDAVKDATAVRRPVMPGESDTFVISLRFLAPNVPASSAAADIYRAWAARWPTTLTWRDRRIVGTVYLASSPQSGASTSISNPRRYFPTEPTTDVKSADGLEAFQARVLATAEQTVANLKKLDAQGVITWDVEGEQYTQSTSYVCSPDQIATIAPEMESKVKVRGSRFAEMKLDDAYFEIFRDAGYRVGVCVRPQHFVLAADGSAHQQDLPPEQIAAELMRKMRFAHDRWGATIFYLDSTVDASGRTLDPAILEQAAKALPDALLIPEESVPRMYRVTAPFQTFLFHGDLGTPRWLHELYPESFSVNLVNDVDPAKLVASHSALVDSVRQGDVLMVHADYWQANNESVVSIYREAGRR